MISCISFDLLMSERKGSHMRSSQSSNLPSNIGVQSHIIDTLHGRDALSPRQSSLGAMSDQSLIVETWSDNYGRNICSNSSVHQKCYRCPAFYLAWSKNLVAMTWHGI